MVTGDEAHAAGLMETDRHHDDQANAKDKNQSETGNSMPLSLLGLFPVLLKNRNILGD